MITMGVEEEYLLIDPRTSLPVAKAEEVRASADLGPVVDLDEVQSELLQAQVEVATPVCAQLDEVGGHLLRLRHAVNAAAEKSGCLLAACATAPVSGGLTVPVTDAPRYRAMRADAPQLVDEQLINGMHVHVGVPDRATAVAVVNRLRPWLPVLVAMGANSPIWDGRDTGFASWRTVVFGRWPVSGVPPFFTHTADYERRVERLLATGVIRDRGQLYWQARISERYPTVEIRALDVQLRADDAVMFAGIVRALVATALHEIRSGAPLSVPQHELMQAAGWQAARHGLGDVLVHPYAGHRLRAGDVVCALVDHIGPALDEAGDTRQVMALIHRLLREGTAADRQRRALVEGGFADLIELITTQSTAA